MKDSSNQLPKFDNRLTTCHKCDNKNAFKRTLDPKTDEPFHPSVGECTSCDNKKTIEEFYSAHPNTRFLSVLSKQKWAESTPKKQSFFVTENEDTSLTALPTSQDIRNTIFFSGNDRYPEERMNGLVAEIKGAYRTGYFIELSNLLIQTQEVTGLIADFDKNMELIENRDKIKEALPTYSVTKYDIETSGTMAYNHNGFGAFYVPVSYYFDNDYSLAIPEFIKLQNVVAVYTLGYDAVLLAYIGNAQNHADFQNRCVIYREYLMKYSEIIIDPLSNETETFHVAFDPGVTYKPKKKLMSWAGFLEKYFPEYK